RRACAVPFEDVLQAMTIEDRAVLGRFGEPVRVEEERIARGEVEVAHRHQVPDLLFYPEPRPIGADLLHALALRAENEEILVHSGEPEAAAVGPPESARRHVLVLSQPTDVPGEGAIDEGE